jgi:hypothetical protein
LNKKQFQQLVISCDVWFKNVKRAKSASLVDRGDEEFDWFIGACSLSWSGADTLPYVLQFVHQSPEWNDFFLEGLNGTVSRICRLISISRGYGMLSYLSSIGFPVRMVIKSIIQQWFFRYLSIQDIQRLTVLSLLKGPHVVICTVASIIDHFEEYQRRTKREDCKQRGMIAFKTFTSTVNISLQTLAPLIQTYMQIN